MWRHYLKIALRFFRRRKITASITIFGLALGFTCGLLILLYLRQETRYDAFHTNAERIYRLAVETRRSSGVRLSAHTPFPVGPAFEIDFPEAGPTVRIFRRDDILVEAEGKRFIEPGLVHADPGFFLLFDFPLLKGIPGRVLDSPDALVLSASMAEKYFGGRDPIGRRIRISNNREYQVTGVMADFPANSHLHAHFVLSFLSVDADTAGFPLDQWGAFGECWTYTRLPEAMDPINFESRIRPFMNRHGDYPEGVERRLFLQSLPDIHLRSHLEGEFKPNNHVSTLIVLAAIALFILALAGANAVNLITAGAAERAREVGLRKVFGAHKRHLVRQFLGESILLSLSALVLALAAVFLLLPFFSSLVGTEVTVPGGAAAQILGSALVMALSLGLVSGLAPALLLSGFQTAHTLKGAADSGSAAPGRIFFRRVLVVFQFSVSVLLIIATLVIGRQLHFLRTTGMGFDREHVLMTPIFQDQDFFDENINRNYPTIKQEVLSHRGVIGASACLRGPLSENDISISILQRGGEAEKRFVFHFNFVDFDYKDLFGLDIIAGRNFSPGYTTDRFHAFILNRTAVQTLGYASPEEALGKQFIIGINQMEGTVIGVTEDYHIDSLRERIEPLVLLYWPSLFSQMAVKVRPGETGDVLRHLEKVWNTFNPRRPFEYAFLDQELDRLYRSEAKSAAAARTFSLIAVLIACLGLFGLSSHAAARRTREIGIRKVLGASTSGLAVNLSGEFLRWVLLANLLAWPAAWLAMRNWLQGFAYRIELGPLPFLTAAGLSLGTALLTVSYQAVKASLADPVASLRHE